MHKPTFTETANDSMTTCSKCCKQMKHAIDDPDILISYIPKFDEFSIQVQDGGDSGITLIFCPWCGSALPNSRRNEWFDELERQHIDPSGENVPAKFLDARWYREQINS